MNHMNKKSSRGSAILEFTLMGIPMIFVVICTVEMARGMWNYHTLQYAVKAATAYASMHGATCGLPNSCSVAVSDVVNVFQTAAIGIPMDKVALTLTTASGAADTCTQVSTCSTKGFWGTTWPPSAGNDNAVGKDIYIRADYTFASALALLFPGVGSVAFHGSAAGGAFDFPGYSHQRILF